MKEIKEQIANWNKMLPSGNAVTQVEAERRASQFLVASAHLAEWIHIIKESKIKADSIKIATYSEQMKKSESKLVTEKKAEAEASEAYITVREEFEYLENDVSYLRTYLELYGNAHVFYRQISKDQGNG